MNISRAHAADPLPAVPLSAPPLPADTKVPLELQKLEPKATLSFSLPNSSATLSATLPVNYSSEGHFPLFLYLSPADKPLEVARKIVGDYDYICLSLPLPAAGSDFGALQQNYDALLQQLRATVPNIARENSTLGGFGSGAEAVGVWLTRPDSLVAANFSQFVLFSGGSESLTNVQLSPNGHLLLLQGDSSPSHFKAAQAVAKRLQKQSTGFSFVTLPRYDGQDEQVQYLGFIGQWMRGAKLPPVIIAPPRAELVARFQARTFVDAAGHTLNYRLFVPTNYKPSRQYPLTLFLHGAGEGGTNNESQLINFGPGVLSDPITQGKHPSFVVAPQCPPDTQWGYSRGDTWPGDDLSSLITALQKEFSIDARRLYVTGISRGGMGSWYAIAHHPELFAAAVPMSAAGDPTQAAKIKDIPIWALHGSADHTVVLKGGYHGSATILGDADMVEALEKAGGHPRLTVYDGQGHGIWGIAYNEPGLIDWMFRQKR